MSPGINYYINDIKNTIGMPIIVEYESNLEKSNGL